MREAMGIGPERPIFGLVRRAVQPIPHLVEGPVEPGVRVGKPPLEECPGEVREDSVNFLPPAEAVGGTEVQVHEVVVVDAELDEERVPGSEVI